MVINIWKTREKKANDFLWFGKYGSNMDFQHSRHIQTNVNIRTGSLAQVYESQNHV